MTEETSKRITVRIPMRMAEQLERLAAMEERQTSEIVRDALRVYFRGVFKSARTTVRMEVLSALEAEGVTVDNVEAWFKQQRKTVKPTKVKSCA